MYTLGQAIKELRKRRKVTQQDLANIFSIDRSTVASWETDRSSPDAETIKKLAEFFDINTDYLFNRGFSSDHYPDPRRLQMIQLIDELFSSQKQPNYTEQELNRILGVFIELSGEDKNTLKAYLRMQDDMKKKWVEIGKILDPNAWY